MNFVFNYFCYYIELEILNDILKWEKIWFYFKIRKLFFFFGNNWLGLVVFWENIMIVILLERLKICRLILIMFVLLL